MTYKRALLVAFTMLLLGLIITAWVLATQATPLVKKQLEKIGVVLLDNKPLTLKGKISWQILPRPAVKMYQIETNEHHANTTFLRIKSVHFKFNLRAFLQGQFVIEQIMLDGVQGRFAATSLFQRQSKTPSTQKSADFSLPPSFSVRNVLVQNAHIILVDGPKQLELRNVHATLETPLELRTKHIPIQLKGDLRVLHAKKSIVSSQVGFKGGIYLAAYQAKTPLNWPRRLSLQGLLDTKQSNVKNIRIDSLQSPLRFARERLHLGPFSAKLYRGESIGELSYDLQNGQLKINQTAQELSSSDLSQALLGEQILQGKLDSSFRLEIPTKTPAWLLKTRLSGNVNLKNATLHAFSLDKLIQSMEQNMQQLRHKAQSNKTDTGIQPPAFSKAKLDGQTQIDLLNISFVQEDALLDLSNMMLETKTVDITGRGQYHFSDQRLQGNMSAHLNGANGRLALLQNAMGGTIPLLLGGSLSDPSIRPDLKKINPVVTALWLKNAFEIPLLPLYGLQKTLRHILPGFAKPRQVQ